MKVYFLRLNLQFAFVEMTPTVASLGRKGGSRGRTTPGDTIQGGDILMKVYFLRLNLQVDKRSRGRTKRVRVLTVVCRMMTIKGY